MADECDRAQLFEEAARDNALSQHLRRHAHQAPGLSRCAECDEPISELRRHAGARLCIDCQSDAEARARSLGHHFCAA